MPNYYVDLSVSGEWRTRTGQSSSDEFYGTSGFQKALDLVNSGEILYVKGTAGLARNFSVPYDAPSGSLWTGEIVTWHDGGGVVYYRGAQATPVLIEKLYGSAPSNDDVITGSSSTSTITQNGSATSSGLDARQNNGGVHGGYVKVVGTNASWTVDGTRAVVDGEDSVADALLYQNSKSWWWYQNMRFTRAGGVTYDGISISGSDGIVFVNCSFDNNDDCGVSISSSDFVTFFQCAFYGNTIGLSGGNYRAFFCSFHDNSHYGITNGSSANGIAYSCLLYDNGWNNMDTAYGATYINCVFDRSDSDGGSVFNSNANLSHFIGDRFTSNAAYGIDADYAFITMGCYFEDNASGNIHYTAQHHNISLTGDDTDSNDYDNADTNQGYVSVTDGSEDYDLREDASMRRFSVSIPT